MPYDTAVTAPPIGSSRSLDWYVNPEGTGLQQAFIRGRTVGAQDQSSTSSNSDSLGAGMALTNAYTFAPVQVQGGWLRKCKLQGSMTFSPIVPLSTFKPTVKDVGWPLGRYVWEAIFHWPANPGVIDSGLVISPVANARINGVGNVGIGLGNVNGNLSFYSRGAGGNELVNLSALAGPTNSLNKLTLVLRQPGFQRDASVTALVNDRVGVTRSWSAGHKLPVTDSGIAGFWVQLCHSTVGTDCWLSELRYSAGPDVEFL